MTRTIEYVPLPYTLRGKSLYSGHGTIASCRNGGDKIEVMIEINADDLVLEYEKNETEANNTYSGKIVKVSGELFFVGESHTGRPMLLFNSTEGTRLRLGAYFEGSWGDKKGLLIEGTPAIVEGIMKEKAYGDMLELIGEKITNFGFTIHMK